MQQFIFLLLTLFTFQKSFCENPASIKVASKITNPKKAKLFDNKYSIVLPCHDFYNLFDFLTPGLFDSTKGKEHEKSYILTNSIYGKTSEEVLVKKNNSEKSEKSILTSIWMQPQSNDSKGYMYLDNFKIISKKYNSSNVIELSIGKDIDANLDRHCIINEGDSLYYFSVADYDRRKMLFGIDTSIIDFDFYEWNSTTNKKSFLFSTSTIVPDSMLVPELFESDGIYNKILDIYHWNWIQKTENNKLLINCAFSGFLQIDLKTHNIDWYWGNNGHSFSKINGIGNLSNPYYTHHLNRIESGPFKGYFSYFENGSAGDSINPFRPALARVFKINDADNSLEVVFEKVYDINTIAMGSISVLDDFVLVNVGFNIPIAGIMQRMSKSDAKAAVSYFEKYKYPQVYLYDLKGNEISNYTYPFGFYSYIAWLKNK